MNLLGAALVIRFIRFYFSNKIDLEIKTGRVGSQQKAPKVIIYIGGEVKW